jgi:tRNA G18 (ribose-2'-O)-methylase SpoU
MIEIDNINDERIKLYRNLRYTPIEHIDGGFFISEGEKVVLRILKSNVKVHSILAHSAFINDNLELIKFKISDTDRIYSAEISILSEIVGYNLHSGVLLLSYQPSDFSIDQLDNQIIALNGVINSENIGAIVRNCSAFDFTSLIVDSKSASPYMRRSVRVGIGNIINIKTLHSEFFYDDLIRLKELNYRIISAEINERSSSMLDYCFPEKFILIFGSEGNGVDKEILDISDEILHIPMNRETNSLNIAVSSAIFMHQIRNN